MKRRTFSTFLLLVLFAAAQPSEARTLMEILRSMGGHPQHHSKTTSASHGKHAATKSKQTASTTQPQPEASPTRIASNTTALVTPAMSTPTVAPEPTVRAAMALPGASSRRDLPYGVPAPNKTGFVTSPYAPRAGLVDVRGFPSGTEVKDPYTGKTFLAP